MRMETAVGSRSNRTWSAFESGICHYCGEFAGTIDHIVPRCLLPKPMSQVPYWFRANNEVPACTVCNGHKDKYRSDCTCNLCNYVWKVAFALYLPDGFDPGIRYVVRSPG